MRLVRRNACDWTWLPQVCCSLQLRNLPCTSDFMSFNRGELLVSSCLGFFTFSLVAELLTFNEIFPLIFYVNCSCCRVYFVLYVYMPF